MKKLYHKLSKVYVDGNYNLNTFHDFKKILLGHRSDNIFYYLISYLLYILKLFFWKKDLIKEYQYLFTDNNLSTLSVCSLHVKSRLRNRCYFHIRHDDLYYFVKTSNSINDNNLLALEIQNIHNLKSFNLSFLTPHMIKTITSPEGYLSVFYEGLNQFSVVRHERHKLIGLPLFSEKTKFRPINQIIDDISNNSIIDYDPIEDDFYQILSQENNYLIECGFVHGDLGSDNILMVDKSDLMVIDFESSRFDYPLFIDKLGLWLGNNNINLRNNNLDFDELYQLFEDKNEFFLSLYFFEMNNFDLAILLKKIINEKNLF